MTLPLFELPRQKPSCMIPPEAEKSGFAVQLANAGKDMARNGFR